MRSCIRDTALACRSAQLAVVLVLLYGSLSLVERFGCDDAGRWYIGVVVVAMLLGDIAVDTFSFVLSYTHSRPFERSRDVPQFISGRLTGLLERLFFSVCVGVDLGGSAVAMVAWTTIKNTTFWSKFIRNDTSGSYDALRTYFALLLSFLSMFFALLGGLVCRGADPLGRAAEALIWWISTLLW